MPVYVQAESSSSHESEISDLVITEEHVFDALRKIDTINACGPDQIPGHLRRRVHPGPWIAEPLSMLSVT